MRIKLWLFALIGIAVSMLVVGIFFLTVVEKVAIKNIVEQEQALLEHQAELMASNLSHGDIEQVKTTGMGPEYIDSLQNDEVIIGGNELILTDTIDRVYTQPESAIFVSDPLLHRTLKVENLGHNSAVLWNPWYEGAKGMRDMEDNGYKTFLCVESALHAPTLEQGKTLQPGESHELVTMISAQ